MNKIFMLLTLLSVSAFSNSNHMNEVELHDTQAFSEGFGLAMRGLEAKEFKIQGLDQKEITFNNYMVIIDGTGLDDASRFALQMIGFRYDDSTRVIQNNWIVVSSFSRKPNADSLANRINKKYFKQQSRSRKCFVYEKPFAKTFNKEVSFYASIAKIIKDSIESQEKILYIKETPPKKILLKTLEKKVVTIPSVNLIPTTEKTTIAEMFSHVQKEKGNSQYIKGVLSFFLLKDNTVKFKVIGNQKIKGNLNFVKDGIVENKGIKFKSSTQILNEDSGEYYLIDNASGYAFSKADIMIIQE